MERILEAAAEHVCDHTVALAAALPGLLADAEPAPPSRRPAAVPVASPFAATRPPAGLRSPSATPSKGSSGDELATARHSSVASHAGHAQLLPSFDSESGSAALGGGTGHGAGSVELPAQDSQQLSAFERIDSVRMPSFGEHFRMPSFRDKLPHRPRGVAERRPLRGPQLDAQRSRFQQHVAASWQPVQRPVTAAVVHAAAAPQRRPTGQRRGRCC